MPEAINKDSIDNMEIGEDNLEDTSPPVILTSGRTMQELEDVLKLAKIDKSDIQLVTQEIVFDEKFSTREYRLLQLDKGIVESINAGEILVFRGDEQDSAVLCTEDTTYEIKEAETSNSLLLFEKLHLPDIKSPTGSTSSSTSKSPGNSANNSMNTSGEGLNDSIILENEDHLTVNARKIMEVSHSYLEMKKMRPNMSKIRFILAGTEFDGTQQEKGSYPVVSMASLLDKVPASEKEIREYLEENRILEKNGELRLVDDDYLFRIFSQVLNCIEENSWNSCEIEKDVVTDALIVLAERSFIEKIFQWFFRPLEEVDATTSKSKYTFKESQVCRFLGESLLKTMGRFNLKEFTKCWQDAVPEGLHVNLSQLSGVAVYDQESSPPVIWHFPEYNLPEVFTERLTLLFETKPRWKLDEISPYIEIFAPPMQNVGNLLTKYARSSTVNGTKYYTAKHGK